MSLKVIAIKAALQAGDTITIVKKGLLDIGNVLVALNLWRSCLSV
jgi:putative protein kinase ArgK-like GTPase of G3E family